MIPYKNKPINKRKELKCLLLTTSIIYNLPKYCFIEKIKACRYIKLIKYGYFFMSDIF